MTSQTTNHKPIFDIQNESGVILMLAAQRNMYSKIKIMLGISFVVSVLIPITLATVNFIIKLNPSLNLPKFSTYASIYSLALFFSNLYIMDYISGFKKKAASIQEKIDVYIFNIPWNDFIVRSKPSQEDISIYGGKELAKNGDGNLHNWYLNSPLNINPILQSLLCQTKNLGWDIRLKEKTSFSIKVALAISTLLFVVTCFTYDASMSTVITSFVISLPVFGFAQKYVSENAKSIKNMLELRRDVESKLSTIEAKKNYKKKDIQAFTRSVQDSIYNYRSSGNPAPNILHKITRAKEEDNYNSLFNAYENKLKDIIEK